MVKKQFENIKIYPDYVEYIIGGSVILLLIFTSKYIWFSIVLSILLITLLWFRVRLIKFNLKGVMLVYPLRPFRRKVIYTYKQVVKIRVMRELSNFYVGSAKIRFDLSDNKKILLKYDSKEFENLIYLIGSNDFNPKIKVGTESLYKKAKKNSKAKVVREYI